MPQTNKNVNLIHWNDWNKKKIGDFNFTRTRANKIANAKCNLIFIAKCNINDIENKNAAQHFSLVMHERTKHLNNLPNTHQQKSEFL